MSESKEKAIEALIETVHRLRAPGGCPWDREQTHQSLRPYLIEEAYEVLDVLDQINQDKDITRDEIRGPLTEEMGDLWLQILLHSEMAREKGAFDIYDVAQQLRDKLVRRHPHVFGDIKVDSADAAYKNWEQIKAEEKKDGKKKGVLDGLPKNLPALQKAARMIEKVSKFGFKWPSVDGAIEKVEEELSELKTEIRRADKDPKAIEDELGDVLFTICNTAQYLGIEPENALRRCCEKFEKRFQHVEARVAEQGKSLKDTPLEEMDQYWEEAKKS